MMGSDGSLYAGPSVETVRSAKYGTVTDDGGGVTVRYGDGTELDVNQVKPVNKVSFHASGVVNAVGKRAWRSSLRELSAQSDLGFFVFRHPRHSRTIDRAAIRRTDAISNFSVDDLYPYYGQLLIAPKGRERFVRPKRSRRSVRCMFSFPETQGTPPTVLQVYVGDTKIARWPPMTYIVAPVKTTGGQFE